jgi:hypothetical protein
MLEEKPEHAEGGGVARRYKIVETSNVTDVDLEQILNEWTAQGWTFEGIHFVMRESSKRPSMAFVAFVREEGDDD